MYNDLESSDSDATDFAESDTDGKILEIKLANCINDFFD